MTINNNLTPAAAREKCKNLRIGDRVAIKEKITPQEGRKSKTVIREAIILAKYPSFILVEHQTELKTKESFTYIDIVTSGCVEKKTGRPRKTH